MILRGDYKIPSRCNLHADASWPSDREERPRFAAKYILYILGTEVLKIYQIKKFAAFSLSRDKLYQQSIPVIVESIVKLKITIQKKAIIFSPCMTGK